MSTEQLCDLLDRLPGVRIDVAAMSGRFRAVAIVRTPTREYIGTGAGSRQSEAIGFALEDLAKKVER